MPSNIESPYPKPRPDECSLLVTDQLESQVRLDIFCFGAAVTTLPAYVLTISNVTGQAPPKHPVLRDGQFSLVICYDGFQVHRSTASPVDVNEGDLFFLKAYYSAGFYTVKLIVNNSATPLIIENCMSNTNLYATLVFKPLPTN